MSRYDPTWESLEEHSVPRWFRDAKFGIYFHWGPYAVPAYANEWYTRHMYREGTDAYEHHRAEWGPQEEFGYKEFVPEFTAEEFDAEEWAALCAEAGAEFVGITATHCDGFVLWDSDLTRWNAAEMGPERDVVGELAAAVRDRGMKFVATFHHGFHWWWYPHVEGYDTADPDYADLYGQPHDPEADPPEAFFEDWRDKVVEVIDGYRPDLIYFDSGWGNDWFVDHDEYRRELVAYYYNRAEEWGKEVDVTHKHNLPPGVGVIDHERTREVDVSVAPWLTDTSVDRNSWGYVTDSDYKSAETLVTGLVDRVSKNGRTMLNVGPKADGTIPEAAADRLREIGEWFETNGEALRDTRPWWTFGAGPTEIPEEQSKDSEEASRVEYTPEDVRFTRKGGDVYLLFLAWPEEAVTVPTPTGRRLSAHSGEWAIGPEPDPWPDDDARMELLGSDAAVEWERTGDGLRIALPDDPPCDHVYAVRIDLPD